MIGLKSRETYEVPGAKLLIAAHKALEQLVLTVDELRFAEYMSTLYADLVYEALWQEPLREDLDQAFDHMQRRQREIEGMIKYHGLQAANYQKLNR